MAPSRNHWKIFLAYFIFGLFLYCQNRYRILRWQSATYFSTKDLHNTESYLWALPMSILAATFGARFGNAPFTHGAAAAIGHIILHILFMRYVIGARSHTDVNNQAEPYSEALK